MEPQRKRIPEDSRAWEAVGLYLSTFSPSTQRIYGRVFRMWIASVGEGRLLDATSLHVARYFKERSGAKGIKPRYGRNMNLAGATLSTELGALRSIYGMLQDNGFLNTNPFKVFRPGKEMNPQGNKKRETEIVDFEAVPRLLDSCSPYTKDGIRDRAFLAALFGAGLRIGEALSLTMEDVQSVKRHGGGHPLVFFLLRDTKNGKDAKQALIAQMDEPILKYREQRVEDGAGPSDPFFVLYKKGSARQMHTTGGFRRFKALCKNAGLPTTLSPHSGRATAISKLLDEGENHSAVQKFSRHASVQTVEVYDKRVFGHEDNCARKHSYGKGKK